MEQRTAPRVICDVLTRAPCRPFSLREQRVPLKNFNNKQGASREAENGYSELKKVISRERFNLQLTVWRLRSDINGNSEAESLIKIHNTTQ